MFMKEDGCKFTENELSQISEYMRICLGREYTEDVNVSDIMGEMRERLVCSKEDWHENAERMFILENKVPRHMLPYINWMRVRLDFSYSHIIGNEWIWRKS